jgi:hypothetical protein
MTITNETFRFPQPIEGSCEGRPGETHSENENHPAREIQPPYSTGPGGSSPSWEPPSWLLTLGEKGNENRFYYNKILCKANFEKADQIPRYCKVVAEILENLPLFDGKGSTAKKCKVISLASWSDARICDIFSRNSTKFLGNFHAWHIHDFGGGYNQLSDANGQRIKQGVQLALYDNFKMCSLQDLEKSYQQVLSNLITGWSKADPKNYPDIMFTKDPQEFELYIKNQSLIEENNLIHFIARKLSLNNDLSTDEDDCNGKIFLRVRKTALENVVEKIGFKF